MCLCFDASLLCQMMQHLQTLLIRKEQIILTDADIKQIYSFNHTLQVNTHYEEIV